MSKQNKLSRWWLGLVGLLLVVGLALWYFLPQPTVPSKAPAAKSLAVANSAAQGQPSENSKQSLPKTVVSAPDVATPVASLHTPLVPAVGAIPATTPPAEPQAQPNVTPSLASREQAKNEVAANARMYGAHASLRTPEVANPDSKTNKRILQTMVLKALAQQSAAPAASVKR